MTIAAAYDGISYSKSCHTVDGTLLTVEDYETPATDVCRNHTSHSDSLAVRACTSLYTVKSNKKGRNSSSLEDRFRCYSSASCSEYDKQFSAQVT